MSDPAKPNPLPAVHFGVVDENDVEGEIPEVDGADDDDDEDIEKTPQDVIDILGFDPLDVEDDGV